MPEEEKGLQVSRPFQALTSETAEEITKFAEQKVAELGLSGFFCIYDSRGLMLLGIALGDKPQVRAMHIAMGKIKTVLAFQRSTSVQRRIMEEGGYKREDFAGILGSLFSGGVAILTPGGSFLGAVAFSGGSQEQDEQICSWSIEKVNEKFGTAVITYDLD